MPPASNTKDPQWNVFQRLVFSWMVPIVWMARKSTLALGNLPLPLTHHTSAAHASFASAWDAHVSSCSTTHPDSTKQSPKAKQPSLLHVLWSQYWRNLLVAGLFKAGWSVLVIFGAYFFVRSILIYVTDQPPFDEVWKGWVLTAFFWLDAWLLGICLQRTGFACLNVGIKIRAALTSAVATKCFNMGHMSKELASEAVAFVASDVNKVFEGLQEVHYLWTAPFEALAILILLSVLLGVYSLPAYGVLALVVPAQYYFGYRIIRNKLANAQHTHARCSIVQEMLPCMKLVKFYAWERYFMHTINKVRTTELRLMRWTIAIKVLNSAMVFIVPPIGVLVVLLAREFDTGKRVSATVSFVALSLFNILRFPLVVLPKAMRAVTEAYASLRNIEHFLLQDSAPRQDIQGVPGVCMDNAVFAHHTAATQEDAFRLHVPTFAVQPGELVGVVGRVGAGKSSLLQAILGNMSLMGGTSSVGGRVAYVPQNPWCQNLTIKDSILFGQEEDPTRYANVLHACALELDLSILPLGDQSRVGVRGINLSGGQRQRLNLARCAYAESDLVLLDGALSAVDHHTALHIFQHCVKGLLRNKAVVLVTHQTDFLPHCDKVAIVRDGTLVYFGPYNAQAQAQLAQDLPPAHLLAVAGAVEQRRGEDEGVGGRGDGADQAHSNSSSKSSKDDDKDTNSNNHNNNKDSNNNNNNNKDSNNNNNNSNTNGTSSSSSSQKRQGISSGNSTALAATNTNSPTTKTTTPQVKELHSATVPITRAAYEYIMQGGWWMVPLCLLVFCCAQATRQVSDYWVRWWTANKYNACTGKYDMNGTSFYVLVYGLLILLFLILLLSRGTCLYTFTMRAANGFFRKSIRRVLHAPLAFFLTTPVGDLLVTFSKDQDVLDEALPDALLYAIIYCILLTATTITVSTTIRYFAPLVAGLLVVTVVMLVLYLPATKQLKKLQSDTKGALVGLVAEALDGLPVIQAFNKQAYFLQLAAHKTDANHRVVFACESLNLWLAFWCDCYGAVLVLAVACFAVAQREQLGPNAVGLAFSNTIQMLVFYTWTVRLIAESIGHFSATEKLAYLANHVPQEGVQHLRMTHTEAAETAALTGKPPPPSSPNTTAILAITAPPSNTTVTAPPPHNTPAPESTTSPGGWSLAVVTEQLPEGPVGPLQGAPSLDTVSYMEGPRGGHGSTSVMAVAGAAAHGGGGGNGNAFGGVDVLSRLGSMTVQQPDGSVKNWPAWGTVEFDGVWMKYAPSAPYALRGVSFTIAHSEKVGVVGRTGSGKSTLLLALYRMFDLDQGRIVVDGVDIAAVPLRSLRRGLSIIPQEPVVFSGTVRTNLDPFRQHTDARLWEVLRSVRLDTTVTAVGGLDAAVDGTGGQAWSLGEQQLVCLARAALKDVPVLCLDEATASMDPHTEAAMVEIINDLFAHRTTLTVAHRLDTVVCSDKVLVLDCGEVKEFAAPSTLLGDPGSRFGAMVDRMGPVAATAMRGMAEQADKARAEKQAKTIPSKGGALHDPPSSPSPSGSFEDAESALDSARSVLSSHRVRITTEDGSSTQEGP